MMHVSDHAGLLRARNGGEQQVTPFELFFDLVFVFAVTQLSHRLLEHLTMVGTLETLLLLLVVWSAWVTTTWVTNWFDPNQLWVRLMLVTLRDSLGVSHPLSRTFQRTLTWDVAR